MLTPSCEKKDIALEKLSYSNSKNDLLKEVFYQHLSKGINVRNETQFKYVLEKLKSLGFISNSLLSYNDINTGSNFSLRQNVPGGPIVVYSLYSIYDLNPDGPFQQLGFIDKKGELVLDRPLALSYNHTKSQLQDYKEYLDKSGVKPLYRASEGIEGHLVLEEGLEDKKNNEEIKPKENPKNKDDDKFVIESVEKTSYDIKKGDTLWSIVKTFYGIDGKTSQDFNKIANIIYLILKLPENKKINPDMLKIGQTLFLPNVIKSKDTLYYKKN